MANHDIYLANVANPIKHGTVVVSADKHGHVQTEDSKVWNTPEIADIEHKYDDRFDDPQYYTA